MGFLSSRNINLLNLHASGMKLIDLMAWVFGVIFLYEVGLPVSHIFFVLGSVNFFRIPLRFLIVPVIARLGLRKTLIISTVLYGSVPVLLTQVSAPDIWLGAYVLFAGLSSAFYWTSFHSFYTLSGDANHRGKHFAVMESAKWFITALAPYLSGVFIELQSFSTYFYLVLPLMAFAVLPLCFCAPVTLRVQEKTWKEEFLTFGGKSHFMAAAALDVVLVCWPLMVFLALGKISHFGAVLTIGLIVQAFIQLALGHLIDRGYLWRIFVFGIMTLTLCLLLMSVVPISLTNAAVLEGLFALAFIHVMSGFGVSLYNDAHESRNTLWYWIFSEMWVDAASCLVKGSAGVLVLFGVALNHVLLVAFFGVFGLYFIMKKHLKGNSARIMRHPETPPPMVSE